MGRFLKIGVLVLVAVGVGWFVVPPFVELRRVERAVSDLEALSDGAKRYLEQTGKVVTSLDALLHDPGVPGWKGPYLPYDAVPKTPWGGEYALDVHRGLVGLAAEDARVPAKYRFGGIAELSLPIRENPQWWASDLVSR